ncbi:MAG: hypothetical protein LBS42_07610 [Tannerella sp.]|jgi:hypothetical protein|nr:hypothetical protein [Tannerella sp.]
MLNALALRGQARQFGGQIKNTRINDKCTGYETYDYQHLIRSEFIKPFLYHVAVKNFRKNMENAFPEYEKSAFITGDFFAIKPYFSPFGVIIAKNLILLGIF